MDRVTSVTNEAGTVTKFTYDKVGNQLTITEADGAQYRYTYDTTGNVTSITNPLGGVEYYTYDANGKVTSYKDADGNTIRYTYDKNGNTTSVTDGKGNKTTYTYDKLNRLVKETCAEGEVQEYSYDALGNLTKYKDAEGGITKYTYDALGNMTKTISPKGVSIQYTYDKHGNVLTRTDAKGNITRYEVNLHDQVTKLVQPNGGVYTYQYDKAGRLVKTTSPLGFTTTFTYDLMDNVIKETNSLGQTTTYTYDVLGRMTKSVNAGGASTVFGYDFRNNLTSETNALGNTTTYRYDMLSRLVEEKNPLGYSTKYTYDPVGNLESMLAPGGAKTSYSYDANGNVTKQTDPLGNATTYTYDKSNRLTKVTDALKQAQTYQYDAKAQITKETDKAGNTTGYTYDLHGNVVTVTDRAGYNTNYSYDSTDLMTRVETAGGSSATYTYDNMGNLLSYSTELGSATTYTYDLEGRQLSRTDATGRTETYAYDAAGRLTAKTSAGGDITSYDYDALNQLIEKAYSSANGETSEDGVIYGYDALGQRLSMTDGIGASAYEYDALGQIISAKDSAGQTITYAYDGRGNITEIGYPDGTKVTYTYDLSDNLTKVTDRNGESTTYTYDALNRLTATYRPNYLATYVTYDKQDNITKLETIHTVTGRVTASYEYTYNEEGYITEEKVKETIVSQWFEEIYDLFLDTIFRDIDIDEYEEIKVAWKKFYDAHHTLCDHNDADGDGKYDNCYWDYLTATTTYSYRYDENWQLTSCTETIQGKVKTTYEYWYDADGNRTKYVKSLEGKTLECYTYKYNKANQLVSRTNERLLSDNVTTYSYDADGNLITEQTGCFEKTYEYDAENRLSVVKAQGTVLMAALYDGDGNRLFTMDYTGENTGDWDIWIPECGGNADSVDDNAKDAMKELASLVTFKDRDDYTITEYVNDITRENEEVLAELNPRGKITTAYTYGYTRESADSHGETQYYLYDGQNNVSRIASEWGRVKESYNYDPYGNLTYGIPDTVNYYGYNGESQNLATGLQYLRARYYNPHTGNFLTEDTYPGQISDPLSLNRYDYVSNNPVNYDDPSGHIKLPSWMKDGIDNMKKGVEDVANTVKKGVKSAVDTVKKAVKGVGKAIEDGWDKLTDKDKDKGKKNTGKGGKNREDDSNDNKNNRKSDTPSKNDKNDKNSLLDTLINSVLIQEEVNQQTRRAQEEVVKNVCDWAKTPKLPGKIVIGGTVKGITNAYDLLSEETKKNVKESMDDFNVSVSESVLGDVVNEITTDNEKEEELFDSADEVISNLLAFEYNAEDDYYYTNENYGIQRYAGFHDAIDDFGGLLGMDLDTKVIEYQYNNVNYRLQFWKGSYGAGNAYGGEIGLYSNTDGNGWYATVEGEQEIRTEQWLIDKNTGEVLLHNDVADYTDDDRHFWNLAIRTSGGYDKNNLTQESMLYIDDEEHRNVLYKKIQDAGLKVERKGENGLYVVY